MTSDTLPSPFLTFMAKVVHQTNYSLACLYTVFQKAIQIATSAKSISEALYHPGAILGLKAKSSS